VRDYLVGRGVSATRIETAGRGEREPIADNGTAEGRAKNRRVEIFLREPSA
jgi:outer membrane protein OmpA-like peptidoglycan-associated protein